MSVPKVSPRRPLEHFQPKRQRFGVGECGKNKTLGHVAQKQWLFCDHDMRLVHEEIRARAVTGPEEAGYLFSSAFSGLAGKALSVFWPRSSSSAY
ncbi:hypothetical protein GCM10007923_20010 [Shinella yambaruensis]|uniref:Uncharacterized protein n=1 Tax=Shinella yambaruensis TaxID=415996 RepID=A0ABQ5ZIQ9_9HYPH|nr:hypothetical protein GCM10007923_20010 [Shinella yambaruensis]